MHARLEEVQTEPEILPPLFLLLKLCMGVVGLVALSSIKQHDFPQKWRLTTNLVVAVSKHSWDYAPLQTCLTRMHKQRLTCAPPPICQHRKVIFLQRSYHNFCAHSRFESEGRAVYNVRFAGKLLCRVSRLNLFLLLAAAAPAKTFLVLLWTHLVLHICWQN